MLTQGLIFIISGPSGSGKTTLVKRLFFNPSRLAKNIQRAISYTSRPIRKGEIDGKDYFFISRNEFEKREKEGEFIETKKIVGNLYGTPRNELNQIIDSGKDALLCIDVRGARDVKRLFAREKVVSIFVLPPTIEDLLGRLKGRSSETSHEIKKRLNLAKQESKCIADYDYVVINSKVDLAVKKLGAIIVSERVRRKA